MFPCRYDKHSHGILPSLIRRTPMNSGRPPPRIDARLGSTLWPRDITPQLPARSHRGWVSFALPTRSIFGLVKQLDENRLLTTPAKIARSGKNRNDGLRNPERASAQLACRSAAATAFAGSISARRPSGVFSAVLTMMSIPSGGRQRRTYGEDLRGDVRVTHQRYCWRAAA